ncbi:MAG: homoserine kinase [Thermoprotei archaeon]|nr:MAG: homoserine kinase [Thermoprotei archaeon]
MGLRRSKTLKRVTVEAVSSIANLGCMFDLVGMAIPVFRDRVTISEKSREGLKIRVNRPGIPEGKLNVAYPVIESFRKLIEYNDMKVEVYIDKGVPSGVGLGSSGATAAATAVALNELFGTGLSIGDLIALGGEGDRAVAGEAHYDNVSASILGGIVIVNPKNPREFFRTEPRSLEVVLFLSKGRGITKTRSMRQVLPRGIDLSSTVYWNWTVSKFTRALIENDLKSLGEAISEGGIVEEVRAKYIKRYWEIKRAALESGALGFNISGAGPSMFAICKPGQGYRILLGIKRRINIEEYLELLVTSVDLHGARVLS